MWLGWNSAGVSFESSGMLKVPTWVSSKVIWCRTVRRAQVIIRPRRTQSTNSPSRPKIPPGYFLMCRLPTGLMIKKERRDYWQIVICKIFCIIVEDTTVNSQHNHTNWQQTTSTQISHDSRKLPSARQQDLLTISDLLQLAYLRILSLILFLSIHTNGYIAFQDRIRLTIFNLCNYRMPYTRHLV